MKKKTVTMLLLAAGISAALSGGYAAEEAVSEAPAAQEAQAEEAQAEDAQAEDAQAEEADSLVLAAPTDFSIDPNTGEYSFTANDDRMGYYFIRVYALDADGNETGTYVASSKRIKGNTTGQITGSLDMSAIPWGAFHINLVSFAPQGTDYVSPDAISLKAVYGMGQKFEKPELMAIVSGGTLEAVVDWYTISDYAGYEYLTDVAVTVWADADCTEEVASETIDTSILSEGAGYEYIPPANAYSWGYQMHTGTHLFSVVSQGFDGSETTVEFSYRNDLVTFELEPGTYYVTAQALSRDEYCLDSEISDALEVTVGEGESTEEYTAVTSSLWADPVYGMERMYASVGAQTDRVDFAGSLEHYGELVD